MIEPQDTFVIFINDDEMFKTLLHDSRTASLNDPMDWFTSLQFPSIVSVTETTGGLGVVGGEVDADGTLEVEKCSTAELLNVFLTDDVLTLGIVVYKLVSVGF